MICPKCGRETREGRPYCDYCGSVLTGVQPEKNPEFKHPNPKRNWKLFAVIVLVGVLIAGFGIGVFFVIDAKSTGTAYTKYITSGQDYLADQEYEQAIVAFKQALKEDPNSEEAYIGIVNAYQKMGNYALAFSYASKGYDLTKAVRLRNLLEELEKKDEEQTDSTVEGVMTSDKKEKNGDVQTMEVNWSPVSDYMDYTYEEYSKYFGKGTMEQKEGSVGYAVRHEGLKFTCYYKGEGTQSVIDSITNMPKKAARPYAIEMDDILEVLPELKQGVSIDTLEQTFQTRIVTYENKQENRFEMEIPYQKCTIRIACDKEGTILEEHPWNMILLPYVGIMEPEKVRQSGKLVNAVDGHAVPDASMKLRSGKNAKTGAVVYETVSEYSGSYEIMAAPGNYTLEVEAEGFITEYIDVTLEKNVENVDIVISPELAAGEVRIVLEWGESPRDLDSYLFSYLDGGQQGKVSFRDPDMYLGSELFANLDIDDTTGYGPETITVKDVTQGVFDYLVVQYSSDGILAGCGATVKLYMPGEEVRVYTVPASLSDNLYWPVFTIDHGQVRDGCSRSYTRVNGDAKN